jgi:hypothetical protein
MGLTHYENGVVIVKRLRTTALLQYTPISSGMSHENRSMYKSDDDYTG